MRSTAHIENLEAALKAVKEIQSDTDLPISRIMLGIGAEAALLQLQIMIQGHLLTEARKPATFQP
jgi:hypothetical protein